MKQLNVNYKKVTFAVLLALGAMVPFMPMIAQACGGMSSGAGGC